MAVAEASFSTSTFSISLGLMELRSPPMKPLITTSASLLPVIELLPRMRMLTLALGEASLF